MTEICPASPERTTQLPRIIRPLWKALARHFSPEEVTKPVLSPLLKVVYDPPSLSRKVRVDPVRAAQVLLENGMPRAQFNRTSLVIEREAPADANGQKNTNLLGEYRWQTYSIHIYRNSLLSAKKEAANKVYLHEAQHALDHDEIASAYSSGSINRRQMAFEFAGMLFPYVSTGGSFAVGANFPDLHAVAAIGVMLSFTSMLISPDVAMGLEYYTNRHERRARKFARELNKDPKWQNIITCYI